MARLDTAADCLQMEEWRPVKERNNELAELFGVDRTCFSDAMRGVTWAHLGGTVTRRPNQTRKRRAA